MTSRIARMIAATVGDGIRLDRDRDRGAAARGQSDQAAAAALQRAAARRQVVSLYSHHRRITGRRRFSSIAARAPRPGRLLRAVRLCAARSTARSTALQRAFLLRSCSDCVFESRTRPCLLHQIKRCSAPCTQEIEFAELWRTGARGRCVSFRPQPVRCRSELAAEMEAASNALDFERAAIYRDRLAALSAIQSHQGINPHSVEEADVFAVHQDGGYTCVEVFFFRTGQNWGNRAYFPKADRSLDGAEVLECVPGAVLRRQAGTAPDPALARFRRARIAGGGADRQERAARSRSGCRSAARSRNWSMHALANAHAKRLAASLPTRRRSSDCLKGLPRPSRCRGVPRRIEVYDNSHIQRHQRGRRHDRGRAGRLSQEPVSQVQHSLDRRSRRATITA